MARKFTLRTLFIAVAAIAVGIGVLLNPTTRVAAWVVNGVLGAILVGSCLAAGMRQPMRSFWLGFAIVCSGILALDELSQREIIEPPFVTRKLASMMEEALPPIPPLHGEPGARLYFRTDGRFPIQYFTMNDDGTAGAAGVLRMQDVQREGLVDEIGPLEELPHTADIPRSRARATICRYALAMLMGLVGGVLSIAIRRRGDLQGDSRSPA